MCRCNKSTSAGGALAVDRVRFSQRVTDLIKENSNIEIINEEVKQLPKEGITVVASGPLTSKVYQRALWS